MKVFLDTNVAVDFSAEREPFYEDAATIIDMAYHKETSLIISSLTIVNMAYVMRKVKTREQVTEKIKQLMALCTVSPINKQVINNAIASRPSDFEDAVQYFSALQANADLIITRDTKGFADFDLPVMTPAEFLARCAE